MYLSSHRGDGKKKSSSFGWRTLRHGAGVGRARTQLLAKQKTFFVTFDQAALKRVKTQ